MENKQRTPLKLAIEELKTSLSLIKVTTEYAEGYYYGVENALRILRNLKPKEIEMLESVYNGAMKSKYTNGFIDLTLVKTDRLPETFEQYYNDNLTQE